MAGPTVGLDVGSSTIKVAQVAPGRDGVVVQALGVAPTPPGAMESNVIVDVQLMAQAVRQLLREAGVSTKTAVSSVSGQSALVVRVIEVPKMSDSELAETMRWEVERHVPFAVNEVIMDFQPINRSDAPADAQTMEVLLAVAQQDMVDRHVEMLLAAGLKPIAIDVEPLAAARSLIELGPDPYGQKTTVIVNIGASNTDIGIFRDGILAFPRTLPLAGDSFTRAVSAGMNVTEEQAEELKRKYGEVLMDQIGVQPAPAQDAFLDFSAPAPAAEPAAQPGRMPFDFSSAEEAGEADTTPTGGAFDLGEEPAAPAPPPSAAPAPSGGLVPAEQHDPTKLQVFSAIAPVLAELVTELRRSLEYYRGRSADGRIDEILLCGGTARMKKLDQFLTSELGVPTRVANPFQYARVASQRYSSEYLEDMASSFPVAIGLAARDMVAVPAGAGGRRGKK